MFCLSIFTILFPAIYGAMVITYLIGWVKNKFHVRSSSPGKTYLSVIIAARNEERNIKNIIRDISEQDYNVDDYELIVIDDNSDDQTKKVIAGSCDKIKNFKFIDLSLSGRQGKKQALAAGINIASGKLIITTDADCRVTCSWLSAISSFYETHAPKMIIGPVMISQGKNILHKFQEIEFAGLISSSAGMAGIGRPVMCNGANLAFEKETFIEFNDALENSIPSGDDIFFMLKIKKKYPSSIMFLKSSEALVTTESQKTIKDFINQRIRWVSKSKHYKDPDIVLTSLAILLFNIFILFSFALKVINVKFPGIPLLLILFKSIIDLFLLNKVSSFFHIKKYLYFILPFELIYIVYIVIIGILGNFCNYEWKKRIY